MQHPCLVISNKILYTPHTCTCNIYTCVHTYNVGVSICQALESDEEEEGEREREREREEGGRSGPLPAAVNDPHELSSALMKALRVGEEEEGVCKGRGEGGGGGISAVYTFFRLHMFCTHSVLNYQLGPILD